MSDQGEFVAGWFKPLQGNLPGHPLPPRPPITKPPLPPGWGEVTPPIEIPTTPEHPIFLPERPDKPQLPPGFVWPPFNPGDGVQGKVLALVWIPGVGSKWVVLDVPELGQPVPPIALPPGAQPKR